MLDRILRKIKHSLEGSRHREGNRRYSSSKRYSRKYSSSDHQPGKYYGHQHYKRRHGSSS